MIDIIPAMDIIAGKCVRLRQGNFGTKKFYSTDPVSVAREYEKAGLKYLHFVDLDGARQKTVVNWKTLHAVASSTSLKINFGGGIQSREDLIRVIQSGAYQVVIGSLAVRQPALVSSWIKEFGSEKIILGVDVKDNIIKVAAWQEEVEIGLNQFIQNYTEVGIRRIICTDISKDGMLNGPAFSLYRLIKRDFPLLHLVASGGISTINDIQILQNIPVDGIIIGKALYEKKITLDQLKNFLC